MANATLITLLGTVKKCGAFKICHELPAAKDPDVTIAPGKKQVMLILYISNVKITNFIEESLADPQKLCYSHVTLFCKAISFMIFSPKY